MPSDPLNLEPKNGDFVDYIESLQASSQKNLDGITPPMTADHHIGLPPNAAGRADDGISLKSTAQNGGQSAFGKRRINRAGRK